MHSLDHKLTHKSPQVLNRFLARFSAIFRFLKRLHLDFQLQNSLSSTLKMNLWSEGTFDLQSMSGEFLNLQIMQRGPMKCLCFSTTTSSSPVRNKSLHSRRSPCDAFRTTQNWSPVFKKSNACQEHMCPSTARAAS